ncbi:ribosomal large subunit pseudouridine synthase D [Candidatus Photodesmus blepharus]|uniref:Pseudouridine synthase n=1 Tax=Candidatus Photodesmus blepharonis TaxID=1179155 RepID=A0A084CNU6_9GAMM|nr:ribosomal large subunit pseudouridine synthase D [Candidatus Photodesmus blepharus]
MKLIGVVKNNQLGQRLDQTAAQLFANFSRSRLKKWLLDGKVQINGSVVTKPRTKVVNGEVITVQVEFEDKLSYQAQEIPLNIIYEDDDLLIIDKPRDFVVHPGAGVSNGTMLNALLHYYPDIIKVPRAGIIHRLDKNTTGLLVVAKNMLAHSYLTQALQRRNITREYEAIAVGRVVSSGKIEGAISRHSIKRTLMAINPMGKYAVTHYRVVEHFREYTRVFLRLETGRTHQIRVHMSYLQHPLLGDIAYGAKIRMPQGVSQELSEMIRSFDRQALHARMLTLQHPTTKEVLKFYAPLPSDISSIVKAFREDVKLNCSEVKCK